MYTFGFIFDCAHCLAVDCQQNKTEKTKQKTIDELILD